MNYLVRAAIKNRETVSMRKDAVSVMQPLLLSNPRSLRSRAGKA
jgi:hypothetical protein